MSGLKVPFKLSCSNVYEENVSKNIESSIKGFLTLLMDSANGSFKPDYDFGFTLKNTRFENSSTDDSINKKKLAGISSNINAYAYELKEAIRKYEPRLLDPLVEMTFTKRYHLIVLKISGKYKDDVGDIVDFQETKRFHIWSR